MNKNSPTCKNILKLFEIDHIDSYGTYFRKERGAGGLVKSPVAQIVQYVQYI